MAQDAPLTVQVPSSGQEDSIAAHCRAFATCKYELVKDARVQHIELSVGHKMLQIAGLEADEPSLPNKPSFARYRSLHQKFSNGGELTCDDMQRFEEELDELMAYTMSNATAICATIAGAADHTFMKSYSAAELIVVDEASRVPEFHWWPLLAFYPKAVGKVMVGDRFQLPPRVDDGLRMENPCQAQLEMSLQERAQRVGVQAAFFTVQYRAMPEIAEIYSTVCYQSRLDSDDSTHLDHRPLAQQIVRHNAEKYDVEKPIIFFNISNACQNKEGSEIFCLKYGNMVLRILQDLLTAGFGSTHPCTIAILTPYKAELHKLWLAKGRMARRSQATAAAEYVSLETADKVQGMEYDSKSSCPAVSGQTCTV